MNYRVLYVRIGLIMSITSMIAVTLGVLYENNNLAYTGATLGILAGVMALFHYFFFRIPDER